VTIFSLDSNFSQPRSNIMSTIHGIHGLTEVWCLDPPYQDPLPDAAERFQLPDCVPKLAKRMRALATPSMAGLRILCVAIHQHYLCLKQPSALPDLVAAVRHSYFRARALELVPIRLFCIQIVGHAISVSWSMYRDKIDEKFMPFMNELRDHSNEQERAQARFWLSPRGTLLWADVPALVPMVLSDLRCVASRRSLTQICHDLVYKFLMYLPMPFNALYLFGLGLPSPLLQELSSLMCHALVNYGHFEFIAMFLQPAYEQRKPGEHPFGPKVSLLYAEHLRSFGSAQEV
jgi:hypothetical protein